MSRENETGIGVENLSAALQQRSRLLSEHLARERELLDAYFAENAERVQFWEELITNTQAAQYAARLGSYKSLARSMAGLLGSSIREQAKLMIPFEIAEATKEFARFLGTKDPSALASALKHALAAKQYAAAAKTGGASASFSGGGGAAPAAAAAAGSRTVRSGEEVPARVIVKIPRGAGVVDTYEFARTLIESINENIRDDVILEAES